LESSHLDIPEKCVRASKRLEDIEQDIGKLVCEVVDATTRREASDAHLQGLTEQNYELKRRDKERLTEEKLQSLTSVQAVKCFHQAASQESQRLKELLGRCSDHLLNLASASFQRDVERRVEEVRVARDREAVEQLKRQEAATAKMVSEMQQQLEEERGKPKQDITSCVVCHEAPNDVVMMPCRHKCICTGCFDRLKRQHPGRKVPCPICRKERLKQYSGPVFEQGHHD